jgi:hypothetical protein
MASVYRITSPSTPKVYVGSTIQPIDKRFRDHKGRRTEMTSSVILRHEDARIELLEQVALEDRYEREQHWIDFYGEDCVNKMRALTQPTARRVLEYNRSKVRCPVCESEVSRRHLARHKHLKHACDGGDPDPVRS